MKPSINSKPSAFNRFFQLSQNGINKREKSILIEKGFIIMLFLTLSFQHLAQAQTISTSSIVGTSFCAGASVNVAYTKTGVFVGGNIFTAELSDASGSFTTATAIGTVNSVNNGTIAATIPGGTTTGSGYRIRVRGSNPAITGSNNGTNLSVFNGVPGSPNTYGNGVWNAYVYNATDYTTNYSGYYTTAAALSYNTTTDFANTSAPSIAATYQGCQIGNTNYSIRLQRSNFTSGVYQIGVNLNDDNMNIILNGTTIYAAGYTNGVRANVWTGALDPSSQLEIRFLNNSGPGEINFSITPLVVTTPPTAGSITGNQSTCTTVVPTQILGNAVSPAVGTCSLLATPIQWESSTDNISFTAIPGANATAYTIGTTLAQTTYYRRAYRTFCETVYSNTVTVTVYNGAQGTPNTYGNGVWKAYVYNATDYTTNYSGYFTTGAALSYNTTSDFANTAAPSAAGTYQGCPIGNTNYSIRLQRSNFAPGIYQIGVNLNDDNMNIILNGTTIYSAGYTNAVRANVWTGALDASSQVEIRYINNSGPGEINFSITPLIVTTPPTAGSITGNQTTCSTVVPTLILGNAVSPAVGTCSLLSTPLQWESSTDNISFTAIPGANAATYTIGSTLAQTTYYRRAYRTFCETVYSNTVTITVYNGAQGTPNTYGNGVWNGYVYNATDYSTNYSGYYTTAAALSYNTTSDFANTSAPSIAATYQGCPIGNTNYSIRLQRSNFASGIYQIGINLNDDNMNIILNGTTIYTAAGYNNTVRANVWTGTLDPSSQLEIRYLNLSGPGEINFSITPLIVTTPPSAGSITGNQNTCTTIVPSQILGNAVSPAVGTCSLLATPIQWESSTDNISFTAIPGANAATYTIGSTLAQTTYYRRAYRTFCETVYSNTVTVTVYNGAQGTPNTYGNGVWKAYVYNATDYTTNYSGYFTTGAPLSYNTTSDFANTAAPSAAGTYQGCPIGNTNYSIRLQRSNFATGTYQIGVNLNDDNMNIILNGTIIYASAYNNAVRANVWTGALDASSQIEIRYLNLSGPGEINFSITPLIVITPPSAGSITGNQATCTTIVPSLILGNAVSPAVGTCSLLATPIQWESSTDNISFTAIPGANAATYTIASTLAQTTYYRRAYRTFCETMYSNTVTVTVYNGAQGTPNTYGNGVWNAYVYNATDYSTNYSGYYTTAAALSYNTSSDFSAASAPSSALTYQGCQVGVSGYSVRLQRSNFSAGVYKIGVDRNDDNMNIILNGTVVYTSGVSGAVRTNVWTGTLDANSLLEIRYNNTGGPGDLSFNLTSIVNSPTTNPGSIGGTQTICSGAAAATLTNSSSSAVGTCNFVPVAIQWESSTNNVSFGAISGANAATYSISPALTQTTYFRRVIRTYCDTVYSNTVTVMVNPRPVMTSASAIARCSGAAVNLALTSTIPSTYVWVAANQGNVGGESTTNQASSTISNTLTNVTGIPQVVVYTVSPTSIVGSCAGTAQTVNVTVNPILIPAVTIALTSGSNPTCNGNTLTFTATPTNGGASPGYQWTKNGSNIAGATAVSYSPTAGTDFVNGDVIRLVMTSAAPCPSLATVTSAGITITVNQPQVATFSYSANPYCSNAANPIPTFSGGGVAGTFSSSAGLNFISTATGQINLATSTAGTYTVTNTLAAAGGCGVITATNTITITALPIATFSYTGNPYCSNAANPSPTFSGDGAPGVFSSTAGLNFVSTATGQVNLATSTAGTYIVTNTRAAAAGCAVVSATSSITINGTPSASNAGTNSSMCSAGGVLAANTPLVGTGLWSIVSGPSTSLSQFSSTSNPSALFTPAGGSGVYVLAWTISNAPCLASSSTVTITVTGGNWLGNVSSDWSNAANWCGGVPTATTNVIIKNGANFYPVISSGLQVAQSISIAAAASLTINGGSLNGGNISNDGILTVGSSGTLDMNNNQVMGSGNLTLNGTLNTSKTDGFNGTSNTCVVNSVSLVVGTGSTVDYISAASQTITATNYGNLNNSGNGNRILANSGTIGVAAAFNPGSGTYTVSGSTVSFNGNAPQTVAVLLPNSTYNNLTINNTSGGVALIADLSLEGDLTLTNGTFVTTGFNLTLLSTATKTARIATITGGSYTGNVTMQRYIPAGPTGWATIGMPVIGATVAQWTDDFATSGFIGSTYGPGIFNSVYTYDETKPGPADTSNAYIQATNVTNSVDPKRGYFIYLDVSGQTMGSKIIDVTGSPLTDNQDLNISYTPSAGLAEDGWNLVNNPYCSAVDWASQDWIKTDVDDAIYIYDRLNDQYVGTVAGISFNGGSSVIGSSQSFMVHANSTTPSLIATEDVKVSSDPAFFKTSNTSVANGVLRIQLDGLNGTYFDETIFRTQSGASANFDAAYDAYKLYSFNPAAPNICSKVGGIEYVVNSVDDLSSNLDLPIRVNVNTPGSYTINFKGLQNFANVNCLTFEDKLTNTLVDLHVDSSYTFTSVLDTASANSRFSLHFGLDALMASMLPSTTTLSIPGNTTVSFTNTSTGANSYSWDFGDGSPIVTTVNPIHTYTVAGTYTATLTIENSAGCSAPQVATAQITVDDVTGINASASAESISIFKNEKGLYANYNFKNSTQIKVVIYDILGQQVGNTQLKTVQHSGKIELQMPAGASGIYTVEVYVDGAKKCQKVLF